MAELSRASVFAIRKETTPGTLIAPSTGAQFIPLKDGFQQTPAPEVIDSEELIDDIGPTVGTIGKQAPTGQHNANLKASAVAGQKPEWFLLLESALGADAVEKATEEVTAAASTAGTATVRSIVKMATTANYQVGAAIMVQDPNVTTRGYAIRNIFAVDSGTDLRPNFNFDNAPATGSLLGRFVLAKPASSGHPSFSAWLYHANGAAISAMAGCRTNDVSMTFTAGDKATVEFSYAGTKFFWNPLIIGPTNKFLDFTDSVGNVTATLTEKAYRTPAELAAEIAAKMTAATALSGVDVITVSYSSTTGKFTISTDGTVLSLRWFTGANAANSVGTTIGFLVAADDTGFLTYTSDNPITLAASLTPSYDVTDIIVVKDAELVIGTGALSFANYVCRSADEVSISIGMEQEDVDDICEKDVLKEKLTTSREVTMSSSLILQKYEAALYESFIGNENVDAMVNVGARDSAGNWVKHKCLNACMYNGRVTAYELPSGNVVKVDLTVRGHVSSARKDFYFNQI